jgi:Zinc knuckle
MVDYEVDVNGVRRHYNHHGQRGGRGASRSRGRGRGTSHGSRDTSRFNGTCFNCQKPGHKKAECRSAPKNSKTHATEMEEWNHDGQVGSQNEFYEEEFDTIEEIGRVQVDTLDYLN